MKSRSKYRLLMMLLRSQPSIGGVTALRKHQIMLGTCGLKIYMSERLKPHKSYFITPPCDYKPFDQSAGSSVRTCSKHGEVLNLVYVLAELCQFVGSGSYKPTSDTYFPSGAATATYNQRVISLSRWFFLETEYLPVSLCAANEGKEVVSVRKNAGFNRL